MARKLCQLYIQHSITTKDIVILAGYLAINHPHQKRGSIDAAELSTRSREGSAVDPYTVVYGGELGSDDKEADPT